MKETKQTIQELLTPEAFLQWVRQHSPNEVIGQACDAAACPLARYLQDNGLNARVAQPFVFLEGEEEWITLPEWAIQFENKTDFLLGGNITAAEAEWLFETLFVHRIPIERLRLYR